MRPATATGASRVVAPIPAAAIVNVVKHYRPRRRSWQATTAAAAAATTAAAGYGDFLAHTAVGACLVPGAGDQLMITFGGAQKYLH